MKVKNSFERDRLFKAHMQLFFHYMYSSISIVLLILAVGLFSISLGKDVVAANMVFRVAMTALFVSPLICFGTVLLVIRNWNQSKDEWKAKRKIKKFRKNLAYLVKEEYGYVTDTNIESVRKLATSLYSSSTGDTMYNKMHHQSPEFFNKMILSKAEFLALYGQLA